MAVLGSVYSCIQIFSNSHAFLVTLLYVFTFNLLQTVFVRKSHIRSRIWTHNINMVTRWKYNFMISTPSYFFPSIWPPGAACRDPISPNRPGMEPGPLAEKAQSPKHWTARELPHPQPTFISTKMGSNRISTTGEMMSFYLLKTYTWLTE